MNNKTKLTLASLVAAASSLSAVTVLDENIAGINLIDNGLGIADSYELVQDLDLADLGDPDNEFVIPALLFVKDGATLTVPEGAIMRGQPRLISGASDAPGAVIVTTTGQIDAVGSATNPIIWTTAAVTNTPNDLGTIAKYTGDGTPFLDPDPLLSPLPPQIGGLNTTALWGGLALLGLAPLNTAFADLAPGKAELEGIPESVINLAVYGGNNPNDSSGRVIYNSIRHNGDVLSTGSEIQGLTGGGIGYGTELSFIEIYCSADDGIELFGGTAFMKNVLISHVEDDGLDLDQGYSGAIQFLFAAYADTGLFTTGGGNIGEWDGDDLGSDFVGAKNDPLSYPTFYNHTYLGADSNDSGGLDFDSGWGGNLFNSIVLNFPGANEGFDYAGWGGPQSIPGASPAERIANGTINFDGIVYFNAEPDAEAAQVLAAGNDNQDVDPQMLGTDQTVGSNGLIPLPQAGFGITTVIPELGQGVAYTGNFFQSVSFKGAFAPATDAILWTTGWTALNHLDIMPDRGDLVDVDGL